MNFKYSLSHIDFTIEEMNNCLLTNMFILNQTKKICEKTICKNRSLIFRFQIFSSPVYNSP